MENREKLLEKAVIESQLQVIIALEKLDAEKKSCQMYERWYRDGQKENQELLKQLEDGKVPKIKPKSEIKNL